MIASMALLRSLVLLSSWAAAAVGAGVPVDPNLKPCGDAWYLSSMYTCYDGNTLCPVSNGVPTLRCGPDCYLPSMYSCSNGQLVQVGQGSSPTSSSSSSASSSASATSPAPMCTAAGPIISNLTLDSPPYSNYFFSNCNTSVQVVVTSPIQGSNLTYIGPRVIVAWPGGNSGAALYFAPQHGPNGTLSIENSGSPNLIYQEEPAPPGGVDAHGNGNTTVGIQFFLSFNASATLSVAILGSIRTIRDFVEGPSLLYPEIQGALNYTYVADGHVVGEPEVQISRLWLDNVTTETVIFTAADSKKANVTLNGTSVTFDAGTYLLTAEYNYPQLTPFQPQELLKPSSQSLLTSNTTEVQALDFLSYRQKLLAGAWRFLTYFGRDTMIAALLLQPVLSEGEGSAMEAVLAGVLERINATDGSACHEETIGDYATWLNLKANITSTAPQCDYKMIDTDYYLPVLMQRYLVNSPVGQSRASAFLSTQASFFPSPNPLNYSQLFYQTALKIMTTSAPFAAQGNQTIDNLIHLKPGQIVGEWRDSTYGIGGAKIPYDVNTALVPAALRSIAALAQAGFFPQQPTWAQDAAKYAQVWEDSTLQFFEVRVSQSDAISRVNSYVSTTGFNGSSQSSEIDGDVTFHALGLQGNNQLPQVQVMNSDDCFRHFLVNSTGNQTQLTSFMNSTANNLRRRFPAGLMTDVGMLVANPALGTDYGSGVLAANWTNNAYHGTVVWSWQLAMMARGLEVQIARCNTPASFSSNPNASYTAAAPVPAWCSDETVKANVLSAYNGLWDGIDANRQHLTTEVWSWTLGSGGAFGFVDLGALPPPPGQGPTESDVVQLWSLTFLAVGRNEALK